MNRHSQESFLIIGAKPNTEWALFCELGRVLEKAGRATTALDVAQSLLVQAPLRRNLLAPRSSTGPNAALLTLRATCVDKPSICLVTMPQGWGRKSLGHPVHVVGLLASRPVPREDFGAVFSKLCVLMSDPAWRRCAIQAEDPGELFKSLGDGVST